ncbi:MAG: hypothetical protein JWN71_5022 [Xanthobacteraceae bacterium]|nr:hypothetical protein [Xanthobacteraceae bacterium]
MTAAQSVLHDIRNSISTGSVAARGALLRYVTDLFIVGSEQLSEDDIALFDDVFARLIVDIEFSARALLSIRLASVANAPRGIVRALAFDDDIDVARPILIDSVQVDDPILVETARTQGQEHLLAISRRLSLSEAVTDVLVERGDPQVLLSTAENQGARFSASGYATVVRRSEGDDRLAICVGARSDIPNHLFLKLLAHASDRVRTKLEAEHPFAKREVGRVVDEVAGRIRDEAVRGVPDGHDTPLQLGEFDDDKIRAFAKNGRIEETTAALAAICRLPISFVERTLAEERAETLLVLARAIGLSWPTVKAILLLPARKRPILAVEITQCLANFERLSRTTTQEIVGFYQVRAQAGTLQVS